MSATVWCNWSMSVWQSNGFWGAQSHTLCIGGMLQPAPMAAHPCHWSATGAYLPVQFSKKAANLGPLRLFPNLDQRPVSGDKWICFQKSLNPNISTHMHRSQSAEGGWSLDAEVEQGSFKTSRMFLRVRKAASLPVWHFGADSILIKFKAISNSCEQRNIITKLIDNKNAYRTQPALGPYHNHHCRNGEMLTQREQTSWWSTLRILKYRYHCLDLGELQLFLCHAHPPGCAQALTPTAHHLL